MSILYKHMCVFFMHLCALIYSCSISLRMIYIVSNSCNIVIHMMKTRRKENHTTRVIVCV